MLDEEPDETLVRAERRAMNAERRLLGVIAILVNEIEPARLRKIDLVGCDGKLAANRAPGLHVDLRPVKRGLIRHFDIIDDGILQQAHRQYFVSFPKLGLLAT